MMTWRLKRKQEKDSETDKANRSINGEGDGQVDRDVAAEEKQATILFSRYVCFPRPLSLFFRARDCLLCFSFQIPHTHTHLYLSLQWIF